MEDDKLACTWKDLFSDCRKCFQIERNMIERSIFGLQKRLSILKKYDRKIYFWTAGKAFKLKEIWTKDLFLDCRKGFQIEINDPKIYFLTAENAFKMKEIWSKDLFSDCRKNLFSDSRKCFQVERIMNMILVTGFLMKW